MTKDVHKLDWFQCGWRIIRCVIEFTCVFTCFKRLLSRSTKASGHHVFFCCSAPYRRAPLKVLRANVCDNSWVAGAARKGWQPMVAPIFSGGFIFVPFWLTSWTSKWFYYDLQSLNLDMAMLPFTWLLGPWTFLTWQNRMVRKQELGEKGLGSSNITTLIFSLFLSLTLTLVYLAPMWWTWAVQIQGAQPTKNPFRFQQLHMGGGVLRVFPCAWEMQWL